MSHTPVVLSLPVADRPRAFAFYRDALGLEAIGDPAADGIRRSAGRSSASSR